MLERANSPAPDGPDSPRRRAAAHGDIPRGLANRAGIDSDLAWSPGAAVSVRRMSDDTDRSRRRFVGLLISAPLGLAIGSRWRWAEALAAPGETASPAAPARKPEEAAAALPTTPECGDDDEPTPRETTGPFYTPDSPLRSSLIEPGIKGTRIVVAGAVFAADCRPVAGALLDFWHADDDGEYDNAGYKLRGHLFTDANGRYRLETIVPGIYPGRTRHYHVRVQAPKGRILTTQLYFPGEPKNRRDYLYRPELQMEVREAEDGRQGRFSFKLCDA